MHLIVKSHQVQLKCTLNSNRSIQYKYNVGNHLMSNNFHGDAFWEISLHIFEISVGGATSQVLNKRG